MYKVSLLVLTFLCLLLLVPAPRHGKHVHGPAQGKHFQFDKWTRADKALLREGDVVLRRGDGTVSDFIVAFLKESCPVTHCGVVVRRPEGLMVISSESTPKADGIRCDPLGVFATYAWKGSLAAVRPRLDDTQRAQYIQAAEWYLRQGKSFDMKFDMKDSSSFYCAELLYHVLLRATGEDFLPKRKMLTTYEVVHMDNFFDPTRFELLLNHAAQ